jgi:hypothetical protein
LPASFGWRASAQLSATHTESETEMDTELEMQTLDDGYVYLAKRFEGVYTLAVTGNNNAETEVRLTKLDLLRLIKGAAQLLAESE